MNPADQTVGVIGLGLLGRGIAACLVAARIRVVGYTRPDSDFALARVGINEAIGDLIVHDALPRSMQQDWTNFYVEADSLMGMRECNFIIESIPEDLSAKLHLFEELEKYVAKLAPIATNTSAIPISLLQTGRTNPRRFIGMHWAPPCHVTRFLEVIRGNQTDDATIEATLRLARLAGKDPSLVKADVPGFIVNRLAYALYREAFHLLELRVADIETIDRSVRNVLGLWAAVAGPFRWMDLTGLAPYAAAMERLWPTLSNATSSPQVIKTLVEQGRNGATSGSGFYEYSPEEARRWEAILREHAWRIRELHSQLFPIESFGS